VNTRTRVRTVASLVAGLVLLIVAAWILMAAPAGAASPASAGLQELAAPLAGLQQPAALPAGQPGVTRGGHIAYVYRGNAVDATGFKDLLATNGYSVTLVPLGAVLGTDFAQFDLILIADDTGSLNSWGSAPGQVAAIVKPNKPILGLGEGGYAFFGQLSLLIGWPHGWHGPMDRLNRAPTAPANIFAVPNPIPPDPVPVYLEPVNEVGIYLGPTGALPVDTLPIALEPPSPDHASLILQGCRQLWGFSGNPYAMTATGRALFVNDVEYMSTFQCPTEPPPPPESCLDVSKIADPPAGTAVQPGDLISYTLVYTVSSDPACQNREGKLLDTVPADTIFVPGSASDGISPGADGSLVWTVAPGPASATKSFQVRVSETQCNDQRMVNNRAGLLVTGHPLVISNVVSHPVICPPVGFPNDQPPYAESEIQIHPYPLVTGHPSDISVKISNYSAVAQVLTVSFQTSASRFGIGLDYSAFDSQVVTVPPLSNVILHTTFTPVSSGHYCIQVKVEGAGFAPIYTQHNIDVTEDLQAGVTDTLTFKVRNSSSTTADVGLVVVNTCPGWSAVVSPTLLAGMAAGEVRDAQLLVTPPDPATLGTACHIDVQGWIGGQLIGGIRKLDVPPVHLPRDYQPPWEEPEISLNPDPPAVGQPTDYCIELQNPLGIARVVTLVYSVADFGAGIGFTPIQTKTVTLPPNSLDKYCISWTPAAGGTLHRCLLVTLKQAGYQDERSQRNVDLVSLPTLNIDLSDVVVIIRNPDPVTHTLEIRPVIYGIDPFWKLHLLTDPGDPPPNVLGPGQAFNLHLMFAPTFTADGALAAAPADFRFGDESKVEVGVYMDGALVSGFTAAYQLAPTRLYLPTILRSAP
jgi:hypothetical protein